MDLVAKLSMAGILVDAHDADSALSVTSTVIPRTEKPAGRRVSRLIRGLRRWSSGGGCSRRAGCSAGLLVAWNVDKASIATARSTTRARDVLTSGAMCCDFERTKEVSNAFARRSA